MLAPQPERSEYYTLSMLRVDMRISFPNVLISDRQQNNRTADPTGFGVVLKKEAKKAGKELNINRNKSHTNTA